MTGRQSLRGEDGFTLIELLVTMFIALIVFAAVMTLTEVALRSSAKTATRVATDQRARPVLQRLIDELHSTCIGPEVGPILAGSSGSQLIFLSQTGSAVSPVPNRHQVRFSGGTLSESIYPATGGTVPNWTFAASPSATRQLLTNVGAATIDGAAVPTFRYYKYVDGALSPTPLPTPLDDTSAKLTVQVNISFSVAPTVQPAPDLKPTVSVSDSALVRFSPASEDPTKVNGPCV